MTAEIINGDCLVEMPKLIERGLVFDACITDPPYGTTACAWDSVIPFAPMWAVLKRVVKKNGAIVLFGSQPFTSALVMSNPGMFKYEWIWDKVSKGDVMNAKNKPLKQHENILIFSEGTTANGSDGRMFYRPQGVRPSTRGVNWQNRHESPFKGLRPSHVAGYKRQGENYPASIIQFSNADHVDVYHPTQKPVELMRYLVRTYSNEGDTILDFACGSGSTGVACVIENRNFIGIEKDKHYAEVARARILRAQGKWTEVPKPKGPDKHYPLFDVA